MNDSFPKPTIEWMVPADQLAEVDDMVIEATKNTHLAPFEYSRLTSGCISGPTGTFVHVCIWIPPLTEDETNEVEEAEIFGVLPPGGYERGSEVN